MNSFRRIAGILLILLAAVSIIISVAVMVQIWRYQQPITDRIGSVSESFKTTLLSTQEALTVAQNTLDTAATTINSLVLTLDALERAVDNSQPMIESLKDLSENTLPDTVNSLQNSFDAAQQSSRVIDSVLRSVTSIPFFPGEPYNPPVPLHQALADVSKSMGELPKSFQVMEDSLTSTGGNLVYFKQQINQVKANISTISGSLDSSKLVLEQYQGTVSGGLVSIQSFQARLPELINVSVWLLTFIFIWLAIFQIYLLIKGVEMLRGTPEKVQVIIEEPPLLEARTTPNEDSEDAT